MKGISFSLGISETGPDEFISYEQLVSIADK